MMPFLLKSATLQTPLGPMLAVADEDGLYLLEFIESRRIQAKLQKLQRSLKAPIVDGKTPLICAIEAELEAYFKGKLKVFTTPLHLRGTPFQKQVWQGLKTIPYGFTKSYADQAHMMGHALAFRAVANANAMNHMAVVIPCHRVINKNGNMGGYAAGIARKTWLLDHEKRFL